MSEVTTSGGSRWSQRTGLFVLVMLAVAVGRPASAQGTAIDSRKGPPSAIRLPIVLAQTRVDHAKPPSAREAHSSIPSDLGEGARLILLEADGSTGVLSSGFQSACDPDVSCDGKRILFAGKKTASDDWNIYDMSLENREARQVTRGAGQCRSPIYTSTYYTITEKEPWEQIAFCSTLAGQANEQGGEPATSLCTAKLDGSSLQRITYNLSSDFGPAIMDDGRLIYTTWRRSTLESGASGRFDLESINVDGSDRALMVPRLGRRIKQMPCVTPLGTVIFVENDSWSPDRSGYLASVSFRRPLHTYRSISGPVDGHYRSPAPLPDGQILVCWRPRDSSSSFGVYRVDTASGRREPVLDDPQYHEFQAKAVYSRPRPDGRSSVVSTDDPHAELYCMSIYLNDLRDRSWLPPGSVKTLRVIEGLPAPFVGSRAEAVRVEIPQLAARRIIAEVPVKPDGSFHMSVPASTPIELQLLDDRGLALRRCGWIWARNHQAQGCIGCHEDPELTPPNRVPDALTAEPARATVPINHRISVDFATEIAPIVAAKCATCHRSGKTAPDLELAGSRGQSRLLGLYQALLSLNEGAGGNRGQGRYVHPGEARTSPLVWHIFGQNTSRPWDEAATHRVAVAIPPGTGASLTNAEKQTIVRWIDLGARQAALPARAAAETGPVR
jgi:hypothetical protein